MPKFEYLIPVKYERIAFLKLQSDNVQILTCISFVLFHLERQVPRRPELHPDFPPVHTWVEAGQAGSLSCKVNSEFPPEVHWLKRLTPTAGLPNVVQPPVPDEAEVETIHPQFIANRTIIIGNIKYQVSWRRTETGF